MGSGMVVDVEVPDSEAAGDDVDRQLHEEEGVFQPSVRERPVTMTRGLVAPENARPLFSPGTRGVERQPVLDHELVEGADEEEDRDAAVEPVEEPARRRALQVALAFALPV